MKKLLALENIIEKNGGQVGQQALLNIVGKCIVLHNIWVGG